MSTVRGITGGTKDVNPQFVSGSVTLGAANTYKQETVPTPIVKVGQTQGSAVILEILKVMVDGPDVDLDNAAATTRTATLQFTTNSQSAIAPFSLSTMFAYYSKATRNAFTAAGTGILYDETSPYVLDLTDGAGHGVLVASDNIFIGGVTSGYTGAATFTYKILYRFKRVSLVEYIGIVQSQQ